MTSSYYGILVILPTRNRSDLVCNAVRSLAAQQCDIRVRAILSDNSTNDGDVERNQILASNTRDLDIAYIRPSRPLTMTDHWDWALRTAIETSKQSHVLFLTDRMILKPNGLRDLERAIRENPEDIVAYDYERINDYSKPVIYERSISTGNLYRIQSQRIIQLASRMIFHSCLPRMLNCAVPVSFLTQFINRNGRVFDSISPDFNFCFMSLGTLPSFLFLDRTIMVHYGIDRSTGASTSRGSMNKDENKDAPSFNYPPTLATPIPELITVSSGIAHEYNIAKAKLKGATFPEISISSYLNANRKEILGFLDHQQRADSQKLLAAYQEKHALPPDSLLSRVLARARTMIHRMLTRKGNLRFEDRTQALEYLLEKPLQHRTLMDHIRLVPYRFFLTRLLHCGRKP